VSLDWYPFNGFGNLGKIKSKKAEREKAGYLAALLHHKVEVDTKTAYLEARAAKERIAVAHQAQQEADESLRILENHSTLRVWPQSPIFWIPNWRQPTAAWIWSQPSMTIISPWPSFRWSPEDTPHFPSCRNHYLKRENYCLCI